MKRTNSNSRTCQIRSDDLRSSTRSFRSEFRGFRNSKDFEADIVTLLSSLDDELRRALHSILRFNVLSFLYDMTLSSLCELLSFRDIIFIDILIMTNSHDALPTSDD